MAYTSADLVAIDQAIKQEEHSVRFEDGRSVQFHSKRELLRVRQLIKSDVDAAVGRRRPMAFRVNTSKGIG